MPISLQSSRRGFLKSSLAATASLLAPSWLRALDVTTDPHRFALLSDTHIHVDPAFVHKTKVATTDMWKNLQQVSSEILALSSRPSAIFINGDCAFLAGLPGDYMTLVEGLAPLRAANFPIHLALGNHDHRDNFWEILPKDDARKNDVDDHHALFVPAQRANFFILDSLKITDKVEGNLGQKQLDWLAATLEAHAGKPAIVFVHHNPQDKPKVDPATKKETISGLEDTQALLDILLPRKQVKALVFGHTHDWKREEREGLHLVNLPPVAWIFKEGRPAGWVDLNLREDGGTFELRCLDAKHPLHGEKYDLKWR
jgi:3',5'-cyclic-AMP phosphodiesterase